MVLRHGRQVGPLKAAELQSQAREGAISPLDSVCAVGSDKWVLGYQVKELFPAWLAAEIRERLAKGEGVDDLLQTSPSSRQESIGDERVVILVVDGDRTPTSRRFIDGIGSGDSVELVALRDADTARHQAKAGQGHALLIVGEGFEVGIRGGDAISVAVEEYAPDLLKAKSISMQSLIGEVAKSLRPVSVPVVEPAPILNRMESNRLRGFRQYNGREQRTQGMSFGELLQGLWTLTVVLPLIVFKLVVIIVLLAVAAFFFYLAF